MESQILANLTESTKNDDITFNNSIPSSPSSVLEFNEEDKREVSACKINLNTDQYLGNEINKNEPNIQVEPTTSTKSSSSNITPCKDCILHATKFISISTLIVLWLNYICSLSCVHFIDKYVSVLINKTGQSLVHEDKLYEWKNRNGAKTYILRPCENDDITSHSQEDITLEVEDDVDNNNFATTATASNFIEMIMHHGAGIIPNLLQAETTIRLRDVILRMNEAAPTNIQFDLKETGNRFSLKINPYDNKLDPDKIIQKSLKEIASHKILRKTLEGILGPDPALVELAGE